MSSPAKKFKPVRYLFCVLVAAIAGGAALGLVGKHLWRSPTSVDSADSLTSSAQVVPLAVKPPVSAGTPSATATAAPLAPAKTPATSPAASATQSESVRPAMPLLPVAGNLASITAKRATLAEKKLQKEIDDLEAKSASGSQPVNSAVVLSPDDVAKMLELPAMKQETAKNPASAGTSAGTSIVAVQGVDGKLSATLRHNGKLVTLGAGEKFAGGTVVAISRQGVSLRSPNGVQSLSFE